VIDHSKLRQLAEDVIAKYGTQADKPSVHLAQGVLLLLDDNAQLSAQLRETSAKWQEILNGFPRARQAIRELQQLHQRLRQGPTGEINPYPDGCPNCGGKHGPRDPCGDEEDGPSEIEILGVVGDRD
jgi:hypothetical protein